MGSVGGVLDSMLANIDNLPKELQTYLYALGSQTTAQGVTDTVKKIQPMIVASTTQSGIGAAQGAGNVVLARLASAQGRSAGDKFYGDSKFWVKPFGSWADQDDRGGVTGYKARTAGMVGGVDADVKDYRLGLAIGYARSDVAGNFLLAWRGDFPARETFDPKAIALILGGLAALITIIGLGGGASAQANASYGSTSANIGAGLAKTLAFGSNSTFTPSLRADYTWFRSNSYIESGAGALGLNVNSNDVAMFVVAADGKYVRQISERQKFSANFGVGFDLINERTTITSAFAGAPTAASRPTQASARAKVRNFIIEGI